MILITGCAGFIGTNLISNFIKNNVPVVGIDILNIDEKDDFIKNYRINYLDKMQSRKNKKIFVYKQLNILNKNKLRNLFEEFNFKKVIHLAAKTGVRNSSKIAYEYIENNITGFHNVIELCHIYKIDHFIYASSSSIYNNDKSTSEHENTNFPISIYASTKKANELIAHSYSHNFNLKTTGLRFFSVYGPFGRPDMSYFKFTRAILSNKEINLSNSGCNIRDFTFVEDVVDAIWEVLNQEKKKIFSVYNVGAEKPKTILHVIHLIEKITNKKSIIKHTPPFKEDSIRTESNSSSIKNSFKISFKTDIELGMRKFINWYNNYRNKYDEFLNSNI
tara:strand:+ start:745 stop:1743 length:999 start_codon:yes stop_codon:yes gene_type:complete